MNNTTQMMQWGSMPCVRLDAGGYTALIAPDLGSNVIRLCDVKNGIEFFRFNDDNTYEELIKSAEVWGLPTLYLPNRFADGVLVLADGSVIDRDGNTLFTVDTIDASNAKLVEVSDGI